MLPKLSYIIVLQYTFIYTNTNYQLSDVVLCQETFRECWSGYIIQALSSNQQGQNAEGKFIFVFTLLHTHTTTTSTILTAMIHVNLGKPVAPRPRWQAGGVAKRYNSLYLTH